MLLICLLITISCYFEFYGPTPIIPETADPSDESLDYARASVDEMVGHIDQLLESVINGEYRDDLPER